MANTQSTIDSLIESENYNCYTELEKNKSTENLVMDTALDDTKRNSYECKEESYKKKIDVYIKSLENIEISSVAINLLVSLPFKTFSQATKPVRTSSFFCLLFKTFSRPDGMKIRWIIAKILDSTNFTPFYLRAIGLTTERHEGGRMSLSQSKRLADLRFIFTIKNYG
ncbi:hypothetical protein Glove_291g28 [Diversispora epigaea]|uniref:Uncharacterized protein n=1 Tax=Diversispora epigaea TaxID=1348612 RepID=A0A397I0H9_9GLOM|nr:hypothetical protein Glove_291g28 [Diversispora epigaea]